MYVVAKVESLGLSNLTQEYLRLVMKHVIYHAKNFNNGIGTREEHKTVFEYYLSNNLYYSEAEAILFTELDYHEEATATERFLDWLVSVRNLFPDKPLKLDFSLTDNLLGVTYNEIQ